MEHHYGLILLYLIQVSISKYSSILRYWVLGRQRKNSATHLKNVHIKRRRLFAITIYSI